MSMMPLGKRSSKNSVLFPQDIVFSTKYYARYYVWVVCIIVLLIFSHFSKLLTWYEYGILIRTPYAYQVSNLLNCEKMTEASILKGSVKVRLHPGKTDIVRYGVGGGQSAGRFKM